MGRAVVVGFAWVVGAAGVLWGVLYLLLGVGWAAVYPWGFTAGTLANGWLYRTTGRFLRFARTELVLILVIPFLLALHLGGFRASGAVVLWSSLAPIGAMLLLGRRAAGWAFAGFVAAVAVTIAFEATGSLDFAVGLPPAAVRAFAFLNVVAVAGVAVLTVRTFVDTSSELSRQQQKVRELERAYLSQELMLRQQERLATLGKLSAGVAHELNNPAAAAGRGTEQLSEILERMPAHVGRLIAVALTPDPLENLRNSACGLPPEDALERSDRAEALAGWLTRQGVADPWGLAEALTDAGVQAETLTSVAEAHALEPDQMIAALRWIADTDRADRVLAEIRTSSGRISEIVGALKGYSHMDRASDQRVDVVRGLEDTLVILDSKLGDIEVCREFADDLPEIWGNQGELNQAWTNLIANAAEALGDRGTITLRVSRSARADAAGSGASGRPCLRVEVEDDGPGIPEEILETVFDPFVTTKAPGEGTGLGLNLTHRTITERHGGSIEVESRPGRTRFIVSLPIGREEDRD